MFRALYNQTKVVFCIQTVAPLLIKTGRETFDPTRPEMEFVRTRTDFGEVPYLPGSSLKGAVRSHAEGILRTLDLWKSECDISRQDGACVKPKGDKKKPYGEHCFACRTFGYTDLASRVRFTDAYPWTIGASRQEMIQSAQQIIVEPRTSVKIDRRTGTAAGGALFTAEVISSGSFYAEVSLRNYQLWQLGLLALVFRDINAGQQRVGASKSRGLGRVKITIQDFHIQQFGGIAGDGTKLMGVGSLGESFKQYDFILEDELAVPAAMKFESGELFGVSYGPADGASADECWKGLAKDLIKSSHWRKLLEKRRSE